MPTMTAIRAALKDKFGARNYRVTPAGEIHAHGQMPNSETVGWYLYGYTDNADTLLRLELPPKLGRPALPPEQRRSAVVRARVSTEQAEKFERLGGAQWLRKAIDKARGS